MTEVLRPMITQLEEKVKKLNAGESKEGESKDDELSPNNILKAIF